MKTLNFKSLIPAFALCFTSSTVFAQTIIQGDVELEATVNGEVIVTAIGDMDVVHNLAAVCNSQVDGDVFLEATVDGNYIFTNIGDNGRKVLNVAAVCNAVVNGDVESRVNISGNLIVTNIGDGDVETNIGSIK